MMNMKKNELNSIVVGNSALRGIVDIPGAEQTNIPLVQKSHQLLDALSRSGFSLLQYRLIDCYLHRINTHQPQYREVVFEKAELEQLLGGIRIKTDDIIAALDRLLEKVLHFVVNKETGEAADAILFERAEIGYFGERLLIVLSCSAETIPYIFHLEEVGYIKYPLLASLSLSNLHTYLLYMYLLENRFRGHWTVNILILRSILGCEHSYPKFFLFNEKILKAAHSQIDVISDLHYTYRAIKKVDQTLIAFQIVCGEDASTQLTDKYESDSISVIDTNT